MKKYIAVLVFTLFLFSCNSDDSNDATETPINIETTLIVKGNLYGSSSQGVDEQNLVINTEADWNALISLFDTATNAYQTLLEADIDFTAFTVIVAIDQVRGNGGYLLDLDVNANSENIIVTVTDVFPQGAATTVITQPFHIIKISKNTLPIIFQ